MKVNEDTNLATETASRLKCRLCRRGANEINGYLHRVNEKGVPGIWECRPYCNTNISRDDVLMRAIEGEPERCPDCGAESCCKEVGRWQEAIRNHLIKLGVPDNLIDGGGCDSGDPLDLTLTEINQAFNYLVKDGADVFCTLAGPGRGDCGHFVGLPAVLDETTTDHYGKPHGWCSYCWLSHRFNALERNAEITTTR